MNEEDQAEADKQQGEAEYQAQMEAEAQYQAEQEADAQAQYENEQGPEGY